MFDLLYDLFPRGVVGIVTQYLRGFRFRPIHELVFIRVFVLEDSVLTVQEIEAEHVVRLWNPRLENEGSILARVSARNWSSSGATPFAVSWTTNSVSRWTQAGEQPVLLHVDLPDVFEEAIPMENSTLVVLNGGRARVYDLETGDRTTFAAVDLERVSPTKMVLWQADAFNPAILETTHAQYQARFFQRLNCRGRIYEQQVVSQDGCDFELWDLAQAPHCRLSRSLSRPIYTAQRLAQGIFVLEQDGRVSIHTETTTTALDLPFVEHPTAVGGDVAFFCSVGDETVMVSERAGVFTIDAQLKCQCVLPPQDAREFLSGKLYASFPVPGGMLALERNGFITILG